MIVEVHVLQNIAPSNINRDEKNQPKEAMFGGYRRARVSSQSWKRAVRDALAEADLVPIEMRAIRTRRLIMEIRDRLVLRGKDTSESQEVARAALGGLELTASDKSTDDVLLTEYLVFLGQDQLDRLSGVALDNWDDLLKSSTKTNRKSGKDALKKAVPKPIQDELVGTLNGSRAVDLALFGRMLADLPDKNVDGATQVAHAISTHAVDIEWDFFTAVDDLNLKEDTGAGMMGMVDFDSSTLYRYTNIDMEQLAENLGDDHELADRALKAYLRAFMCSIPTGKQNSFAAQNLPAFAFAVVRDAGRWSLANAFVNPIEKGKGDILGESIKRLLTHWKDMTCMYGSEDISELRAVSWVSYADHVGNVAQENKLEIATDDSLNNWIDAVVAAQGASHDQR